MSPTLYPALPFRLSHCWYLHYVAFIESVHIRRLWSKATNEVSPCHFSAVVSVFIRPSLLSQPTHCLCPVSIEILFPIIGWYFHVHPSSLFSFFFFFYNHWSFTRQIRASSLSFSRVMLHLAISFLIHHKDHIAECGFCHPAVKDTYISFILRWIQ